MSTPTPSSDVSVTAAGCPACGQQLPAGRSDASAPRRAPSGLRRRTNQTRARSRWRAIGHGGKARLPVPDCETRYFANSGARLLTAADASEADLPAVRSDHHRELR